MWILRLARLLRRERYDVQVGQLLDQVVLPREHIGHLDLEALSVVASGGGDEQTFGTTGAEALGAPEHA